MDETPERPGPLFLDLDGVILDVSDRYFQVHRRLLSHRGEPRIDRTAFWEMKRDRRSLSELLAASGIEGIDEEDYRRGWLELSESRDFLDLDRPLEGAVDALRSFRRRCQLILVSLRQRPDHLTEELESLGLTSFFDEVLTAAPRGEDSWRIKADLLQRSGHVRPGLTIVGDTEVDIRAGRLLGMVTVAVLSGIRNQRRLETESPDRILPSLKALASLV